MNNTPTNLIFFGRLEERKGLPEFVEALNHLAEGHGSSFKVTFVGKIVPLYASVSNAIDSEAFIKAKLHAKVEFSILGDLDSRGAIEFVRSSQNSVVCLTSPSDNFPNAALEMGQLPRRLVVSDTKGFHQTLGLIGRTQALYWFDPGCSASMAEAIRAAIKDDAIDPQAPTADEIEKLNDRLLQDRLNLLEAAFAAKCDKSAEPPVRIKTVVVLSPKQAKLRDIRRSLLALARGSQKPDSIVVVGGGLPAGDILRLEARFPGLIVSRDSSASLQEVLHPLVGARESGDYTVVMLAGVAMGKSSLANLAKAAGHRPALTIAAESVLGKHPQTMAFQAPSLSLLVRYNDACGSCLMASLPFVYSLAPLSCKHPDMTLWLLVLAAAAQGKQVSYMPLPQHSVRPPSALAGRRSRLPSDEELASLWRYLATLEAGSWSKRELRNLVLSVQQLSFGEAQTRQVEAKLRNASADLHKANAALHEANTALHDARVSLHTVNTDLHSTKSELASVYASHAWRITKPLRITADWLRQAIR